MEKVKVTKVPSIIDPNTCDVAPSKYMVTQDGKISISNSLEYLHEKFGKDNIEYKEDPKPLEYFLNIKTCMIVDPETMSPVVKGKILGKILDLPQDQRFNIGQQIAALIAAGSSDFYL